MKPTFLGTLLIGATLVFAPAAFAEGKGGGSDWHLKREEFKKLSPEEKEKFHAERKAKWEKLSRDEKLKVINERHEQMRKDKEEHWQSLSDDEKLKFAEERMNRGPGEWKKGGRGPGGHDGPPPGGPGHDAPPPPAE